MSPQVSLSADQIIGDKQNNLLEDFLDELFSGTLPKFATFSFTVETIDPLAYLEINWQNDQFQYYWEHPADTFAIAAQGTVQTITGNGPERFQQIQTAVDTIENSIKEFSAVNHRYDGTIFLGGFSFFDVIANNNWKSFEPASFTIPKWAIIKDGKYSIVTLGVELSHWDDREQLYRYLLAQLKKIQNGDHIGTIDTKKTQISSSNLSELGTASLNNGEYHRWESSIREAKQLIADNEFDKIVLARQVSIPASKSIIPTELLNNFRKQYTNCYNFLVHQPENATFLGTTPERLGSISQQRLQTEALAGSMRRGQTATEDSLLEEHLAESSKNISEHNFVVKDIKERLRPLTRSINLNGRPEIKKLSNVQHLSTPIRAELKKDVHILDVIEQLHPTSAVGGYPWEKAAPYINKLETFDRGWYAGPVGWFNSSGTATFAVGIRSGLLTENNISFFAGCGIVADSNPKTEWEETNLKLKPMLSALPYD
ncbi:isochorismate synthase [Fodinibius salinus]|uniref:isochorismate synthase n=1 Tax=Fodinibius salinus TaxID=860790 RepID=A0A5D3YM36_9BACT|nr:isochorismate synthase [Fodinibius salinus]TYP95004.1 isochorismate synthase [Fodinibius salinus]